MFIPIHNYTHYSILKALTKPEQLVESAILAGYAAVGLTDINSISGSVKFVTAIKNACGNCGKQKDDDSHTTGICVYEKATIRPILGCTLNTEFKKLTVICRNFDGWKKLLKVMGHPLRKNNIIPLAELAKVDPEDDWLITTGKFGTFTSDEEIGLLRQYFPSLWLDIDRNNPEHLRELAQRCGLSPLACHESYFIKESDKDDHNLLIAIDYKVNVKELNLIKDSSATRFLGEGKYYFPQAKDLEVFTPEETENTERFLDKIENFDILGKPDLPKFCDGDEKAILREACVGGWHKKLVGKGVLTDEKIKKIYGDRVKEELEVINKAGLAGYFLIVADYVNWAKDNNILTGVGRGSSGSSLVSHLLNITNVDPIKYKLLFQRFYNEGRNTADRIALPDIDTDFPKFKRHLVVNYIVNKYGKDKVANITTFGRLKGRSALDVVLRCHDVCSFAIAKRITSLIPQEAEIIDSLQEQGENSVIHWCLKNDGNLFKEWCFLTEEGNLDGPLSAYFAQAIRVENTIRSQGVHASGICLGNKDLRDVCPMIYDPKCEDFIVGLEMDDVESLGLSKMDLLAVTSLDKLEYVNELLSGRI